MGSSVCKLPIVYDPNYNIKFFGLEKLHAFDSCKYEKIVAMLDAWGVVTTPLISPGRAVLDAELMQVHSPEYIQSLHTAASIAQNCELPPLAWLPNWLAHSRVVEPVKWAVQGTVLAGQLALQQGWAINIGGGMHHASYGQGGGWCLFADIFLSFLQLNKAHPDKIKRMMIVDLDVHQGNGLGRSKAWLATERPDLSVYILDVFNPHIYPQDRTALTQIDFIPFFMTASTTDESYLADLATALQKQTEKPDIIFFNAGTDVLKGDPLNGGIGISQQAVVARDQMVFDYAESIGVPIVMVLSGGYASESAATVAASVANIIRRKNISN